MGKNGIENIVNVDDRCGSRDTHRTKRAYESSKIKVVRLISNQAHVEDLVVRIAVVRMVRQTEFICES